ncbi:MAG: peptidoglycan DD-metalloendopeptidase family protein [Deltaproteobacteria bacterium]|nr:peptidoglycan DD-metalloendopeptidase family protein [Deltaproteobacteria bacterium]
MKTHSFFSRRVSLCIALTFLFPVFRATVGYGSRTRLEAREEIQRIETRLSSEKERLRAFGRREKELLKQLSTMEKEVAEKRAALDELEDKARLNASEMKRLKADRRRLEQKATAIESRLSLRLVGLYKYARKGYLKALVDVKNIVDFWRRVEYLDRVMKKEQEILLELVHERRSQKTDMGMVTTRLNKIERELKRENARLSILNSELEKKVLWLTNIHREKEFLMTTVRDLQRASKNLNQALSHLDDRERPETIPHGRFVDQEGLLPLPLKGKMIRDGTRGGESNGGLYDGVFIEGPPGAEVRVVFPGRVAFSGAVKGYGELIIVDHGSRFYTVSAHLSNRSKSEGDTVRKGDVLGTVGQKGATIPGRLYFEVRRGGTPLDPMKWLKVD